MAECEGYQSFVKMNKFFFQWKCTEVEIIALLSNLHISFEFSNIIPNKFFFNKL
jgi:hypothetical protein